jgi:hypothetical protein
MHEQVVIQGTFADLKTVKTRSVVQMVIEVPIEQGAQIVSAFGFPRPGEEVPVAVARLDPNAVKAAPAPPEKPKKRFHELPLSQQAALRCGDESFWKFANQRDEAFTVGWLYSQLGIESRRELDRDNMLGYRWKDLNAEFEEWAGLVPEQR